MPPPPYDLRRTLASGPLVLDGATGTELERRGVDTTLPLWSAAALLSHPEVVEAIHREYVEAGADIVVANTFRTNVRTLRAAGLEHDGEPLNARAIALARQAVADRPRYGVSGGTAHKVETHGRVLVAASVAPVEDCYHPERVPPDRELRSEHRRMIDWLVAAGPDLIWIETMNTVREARIAAEAARDAGLPFVVSFVLRESGELLGGEPLDAAVAAVEPLDPLAIGVNCIPPRSACEAVPRLAQLTRRPVAVYANILGPGPVGDPRRPVPSPVGRAEDAPARTAVSPAEYADFARRWRELGATIVGGCCGTTPEHIRAVRAAVSVAA